MSLIKLNNNSISAVSALPSGLLPTNTPAFEAYLGSNQSVSSATVTKLSANTEVFDSDSKYDNSAYRFTPTVAGKYYIYGSVTLDQAQNFLGFGDVRIYLNGSSYRTSNMENILGNNNSNMHFLNLSVAAVMNLDGDDYVELFANLGAFGGGSSQQFAATTKSSYFGGYKLNI